MGLPAEITATAVLVRFWTDVSNGVWITVFGILLLVSNLCLVRVYGELEFTFAMLKIMLVRRSGTSTSLPSLTAHR